MAGGEQREAGPLPAVHLTRDDGVQAYTEPYPRFAADGTNRASFIPGRSVVRVAAVESEWVQVTIDEKVVGWVKGAQLIPPIGGRHTVQSTSVNPPTSPYVVVASKQAGNGYAVAALTLGVIGAVLAYTSPFGSIIGMICALLGLIFGLIGLRNVSRYGAGLAGLAISGIVLGSLALALGGYEVWAFYRLRNAVEHAITAPVPVVDATPTANRLHVLSCDESGALVSFVNTSGKPESFRVTVAFHGVGTLRHYSTATTGRVDVGEQGSWYVANSGHVVLPTCTVAAHP